MTREEAIDTLKNGLWWDRKQLDEALVGRLNEALKDG